MPRTLVCMACKHPTLFEHKWLDESDVCAKCGAKGPWVTIDAPDTPIQYDAPTPFALTLNDRRFLRSLKIGND